MSDFWAKYKDPRWQRKRLEIMELAGFKCVNCDNGEETLNVHHTYYEKNADPWDYPSDALKCLCESCHKRIEAEKKWLLKAAGMLIDMFEVGESKWEILRGYVFGLLFRDRPDEIFNLRGFSDGALIGFADSFGLSYCELTRNDIGNLPSSLLNEICTQKNLPRKSEIETLTEVWAS